MLSDAWIAALSALGTGILSLIGVYFSNRTSYKLFEYRLKKLEEKVDKHNDLVERMTAAEGRLDAMGSDIKELKGLVLHA